MLEDLPQEIILIINSFLDVSSMGRMKQTNKYFNAIIEIKISKIEEKRKKRINRLRYHNPYFDFYQKYKHKIDDVYDITHSKCITWNMIKEYDINYLSGLIGENPNIGWDIIKEKIIIDKENNTDEDNSDEDNRWDEPIYFFGHREANPNITFDIIINNPKLFTNWILISRNKSITEKNLIDYPDYPWKYHLLSDNKNISIDFIAKNLDKNWGWFRISNRVKWEDFLKYPHLPWNYVSLSCNQNITWDIIQSNPQIPWDYNGISCNPNITIEIVRANPDINWNYENLNNSGILPFKELKEQLRLIPRDEVGMSKAISLKDIENNPNFRWNWGAISMNPNLTLEFFEKYPKKKWNYSNVLKTLYGKCYKENT
jgi:hypothetical protein